MKIIRPLSRHFFALLTMCLMLVSAQVLAAQICSTDMPDEAPDSRYTDNGNGTVTDKYTGLMWKQCVEGATTDGSSNCTGIPSSVNWSSAIQLADSVNNGTGESFGYEDWRLPNFKELASLHRPNCTQPAVNATAFPPTAQALADEYARLISSTHSSSTSTPRYFIFDVYGGDFYHQPGTGGTFVRLVRDARSKLLFLSDQSNVGIESEEDIHTVNSDGSELTRLTGTGEENLEYSWADWSPDGSKIVTFRYDWWSGNHKLLTMNADGSNVTDITNPPTVNSISRQARTRWSPDGTKIAYLVSSDGDLYVMDADGSNKLGLTDQVGKVIALADAAEDSEVFAWSLDSSKIYFMSDLHDVYSVDTDGANITKLNTTPLTQLGDFGYRWSPDRQKIAWLSSGGIKDIYVANIDGTEQIVLYSSTANNISAPAWSPDSSSVAFSELISVPLSMKIKIKDVSSATNPVTSIDIGVSSAAYSLSWSPSGDKIAYIFGGESVGETGADSLYVLDLNTRIAIDVSLSTNSNHVMTFDWR
ncbi:MAG: hypothetical protein DIZ80_11795 [endosymbiont of Galathealinum brachiosum]|uniref:Lcl C-terminal domain-containing protein n=1 Tax=endosymbiont of Galathealinum brachiosum TaxID=2200906 RepID=A0A370DDH8_9GAMM|nr:MAG: hypothetical protein DIZ80_11795 [endosymbiont of Galathealinum brachiosum]